MATHQEKLKILGKRLQKLRKQKGYNQTKFSMMLNVTREHLSKIERGVTYPSLKLVFDATELLNVQLGDIFD